MQEVAKMTLWCKRDDKLIKFLISVGIPTQVEENLWQCECSLGELLNHRISPIKSINSLLALSNAIKFVAVFLAGRKEQGDLFYMDENLSDCIEDVSQLFGLDSQVVDH